MTDSADAGTNAEVAPAAEAPAPEIAPVVTPEVPVVEAPVIETPTIEVEIQEPQAPQAPAAEPTPSAPTPPPAQQSTTYSLKATLQKGLESIRFRKRAKLEKIIALAHTKGSLKNDDVEKSLHISDATATRYLSQLVKEGKLRRSGPANQATYQPV